MELGENLESLIICVITVFIVIFLMNQWNKRRGLTSYKDSQSNTFIVAEAMDKDESARILKDIRSRLTRLIEYCIQKYPDDDAVQLLRDRFDPENVQETSLHDTGTSYTIDKGKELHLCLRDKKTKRHHNTNLLMFVAIHELAHVMSTSYGHNGEFAKNFKFLLEKAVECNVYSPEDYRKHPRTFCGIKVHHTPLFD